MIKPEEDDQCLNMIFCEMQSYRFLFLHSYRIFPRHISLRLISRYLLILSFLYLLFHIFKQICNFLRKINKPNEHINKINLLLFLFVVSCIMLCSTFDCSNLKINLEKGYCLCYTEAKSLVDR